MLIKVEDDKWAPLEFLIGRHKLAGTMHLTVEPGETVFFKCLQIYGMVTASHISQARG